MKCNDPATADRLFKDNEGLVGLVLKHFHGTGTEARRLADELRTAGVAALWRAARHFDPTRGVQFSTFAYSCVMGEVRNARRRLAPNTFLNGQPVLTFSDLGEDGGLPAGVKEEGGTDTNFDRIDNRELLNQLLAALPADQRRVVELVHLEQLGTDGASKQLGITRNTARQLLESGMKRLRAEVNDRGMWNLAP
jgi:RNA polymerase sigma factor (sigma-70 family)